MPWHTNVAKESNPMYAPGSSCPYLKVSAAPLPL